MDRRGTVHNYDGLVIATGCTARRLPAQLVGPGAQELIFTLRTAADARLLAKQLHSGQRMVVIGAGFVGMELASTATKLGVEVSVVDIAATPLNRVFGDVIGNWFTDMHRRNGVNVRCSTTVQSIRRSNDALEVRLDSNERLLADVVVAGIGGVPAVDWLAGSRVATDNGVLCRPDLQTAVPGVVAAGDVAVWHNNAFGESMRIEHWTNAVEQGRHAAGRLLGEDLDFTSIPYFWTDQFESKLRFVGRADPSDDIVVETLTDESLVALFGRGGVLRGAVCVNAPRKLALYRRAINDSTAWADVAHVGTATSCVTRTT
jgi:NADPH-dependent 2,4-dienoyl-CoA reductase/sulfur reductase-like enzyme